MKKIGIIVGSVRNERVGISVAQHVHKLASVSKNFTYQLIDLKEINLPMLDEPYPAVQNNYQYEHTKKWSKLITEFDGFVFVTPEYNHGYPAALKNAIDYLYAEWHNKPLAFIGYGYSASGARSIEQLRQVASYVQLKALWNDVVINLGLYVKDGKLQPDERLDQQISALLESLEKTFS